MLKYKMEKVIKDSDWDKLVVKTYDRPYTFQQQGDCRPRGVYPLEAYEGELDDYSNVSLEEWMNTPFDGWNDYRQVMRWERDFYPHEEEIAQDLIKKGLMEAGDYKIMVDW